MTKEGVAGAQVFVEQFAPKSRAIAIVVIDENGNVSTHFNGSLAEMIIMEKYLTVQNEDFIANRRKWPTK